MTPSRSPLDRVTSCTIPTPRLVKVLGCDARLAANQEEPRTFQQIEDECNEQARQILRNGGMTDSELRGKNASPLYRELCNLADARDARNAALMADYVRKLQEHDWSHEFSDDYSVTRRGAEERRELLSMQRQIDADYAVWNRYSPAGYRIGEVAA